MTAALQLSATLLTSTAILAEQTRYLDGVLPWLVYPLPAIVLLVKRRGRYGCPRS